LEVSFPSRQKARTGYLVLPHWLHDSVLTYDDLTSHGGFPAGHSDRPVSSSAVTSPIFNTEDEAGRWMADRLDFVYRTGLGYRFWKAYRGSESVYVGGVIARFAKRGDPREKHKEEREAREKRDAELKEAEARRREEEEWERGQENGTNEDDPRDPEKPRAAGDPPEDPVTVLLQNQPWSYAPVIRIIRKLNSLEATHTGYVHFDQWARGERPGVEIITVRPKFGEGYINGWHFQWERRKHVREYVELVLRGKEIPSDFLERALGAREETKTPAAFMKALDDAIRCRDRKDWGGVVRACDRALEENQDEGGVYLMRGAAKLDLNDYAGSIKDCNQALRVKPDLYVAYGIRGMARMLLKDYQGAIQDIEVARKHGAGGPAAQQALFGAYLGRSMKRTRTEDFEGAIEDQRAADRCSPGSGMFDQNMAMIYGNRARKKSRTRDFAGAIEDFRRAMRHSSDERLKKQLGTVYNNRGVAKSDAGDSKSALSDFNEALRLDSSIAITWFNRGNTRLELGDMDGSVADFKRALSLDPSIKEASRLRKFIESAREK